MVNEDLEQLLEQYKSHFAPEKQKERGDLTTRVSKAFTKAMDEFLIGMHGKDENGIPNQYQIGTEKHKFADAVEHAEDIFNKVGMQLLSYAFPDANAEELKRIGELYKKDPAHIQGMMVHKFGVSKEDFVRDLVDNRKNIFESQYLPQFARSAGERAAGTNMRLISTKLFKHENFEYLRDHVVKNVEKLAPDYSLRKESMTMDDLPGLVNNIYSQGHSFKNYIKDHRHSYVKPKK
ncbi:MAG: hypothetical protein KJ583_02970 [Nanoarchaeota archaeon]|nr:hypothetical protein [Nanoarchaeota archaeon]MBU1270057.1 hypothetical protein [Nanoarchaeota archaeon]MBU1604257.1 hypothetical protein [Nanoarchaeota archaeon]MBU2443793.1 hypothetical protein [Nanoarchaeota archaeon]